MSATVDSDRARRARDEPLEAERIAPGMFTVRNLRSASAYTVDMRQRVCECDDHRYRHVDCKHIQFVAQVADGKLCSVCGYRWCRPSCPNRGER